LPETCAEDERLMTTRKNSEDHLVGLRVMGPGANTQERTSGASESG
jgi:hypothetical protein